VQRKHRHFGAAAGAADGLLDAYLDGLPRDAEAAERLTKWRQKRAEREG
jgi:hypothetical protein